MFWVIEITLDLRVNFIRRTHRDQYKYRQIYWHQPLRPAAIHWMSNFLIEKFLLKRSAMSLLFQNYSLVEIIHVLIRFNENKSFPPNTRNTDRNDINGQKTYAIGYSWLQTPPFLRRNSKSHPFWGKILKTHPFSFISGGFQLWFHCEKSRKPNYKQNYNKVNINETSINNSVQLFISHCKKLLWHRN